MTGIRIQLGAITAAFVALAYAMPSPAAAVSASLQVIADATDFSARARGGGGARAGGARVGGGGRSVNVNRNVNRNVNVRRTNVVVRPVRVWAPRPYFGTIVGGIALGTIVAASVAGAAPAAPAANMCWYWVDSAQVQGYWDYCTPPY